MFLLKSLTLGIVKSQFFWLNGFPQKGGISKLYSPWTIVLETGQYIEVHKKSDNRTKSRTQPGVYLHKVGNDLGGGFFEDE